jgi:acetate kinase
MEAVDLYVHRITRELGAMAAVLGGLDAVVFTAGIGERAAPIREAVCRQAAWLGLALDEGTNREAPVLQDGQHLRISAVGSAVSAWVVPTDEERMIARHTQRLVLGAG